MEAAAAVRNGLGRRKPLEPGVRDGGHRGAGGREALVERAPERREHAIRGTGRRPQRSRREQARVVDQLSGRTSATARSRDTASGSASRAATTRSASTSRAKAGSTLAGSPARTVRREPCSANAASRAAMAAPNQATRPGATPCAARIAGVGDEDRPGTVRARRGGEHARVPEPEVAPEPRDRAAWSIGHGGRTVQDRVRTSVTRTAARPAAGSRRPRARMGGGPSCARPGRRRAPAS